MEPHQPLGTASHHYAVLLREPDGDKMGASAVTFCRKRLTIRHSRRQSGPLVRPDNFSSPCGTHSSQSTRSTGIRISGRLPGLHWSFAAYADAQAGSPASSKTNANPLLTWRLDSPGRRMAPFSPGGLLACQLACPPSASSPSMAPAPTGHRSRS